MSRAISQNIAWISAFLLSSLVFALVLGLVLVIRPAQSDKHTIASKGAHGEGESAAKGGAEHASPAHEAPHDAAAHDSAHDKSRPEKPAAVHSEAAEEEISAESFKKPSASGAHEEHPKH